MLNVETGYIPAKTKVTVFIGTKTPEKMEHITIKANDVLCTIVEDGTAADNTYADEGVVLFKFELVNSNLTNLQKLTFENTGILTVQIDYAEIVVEY
jgi:hypothetical protein